LVSLAYIDHLETETRSYIGIVPRHRHLPSIPGQLASTYTERRSRVGNIDHCQLETSGDASKVCVPQYISVLALNRDGTAAAFKVSRPNAIDAEPRGAFSDHRHY
jgi:hypothetical protein